RASRGSSSRPAPALRRSARPPSAWARPGSARSRRRRTRTGTDRSLPGRRAPAPRAVAPGVAAGSSCPLLDRPEERGLLDGGERGLLALVSGLGAGAIDGLLEIVTGQHAEGDRAGRRHGHLAQAGRAGPRHVLEMRRPSAEDG